MQPDAVLSYGVPGVLFAGCVVLIRAVLMERQRADHAIEVKDNLQNLRVSELREDASRYFENMRILDTALSYVQSQRTGG